MLILLVEDEERIAAFVTKGLQAEGYSWVRARDGGEALALAGTEPIDLVVLDLVLPDGSGLDVLTALRRTKAGLPVMILTALDDVGSRVRGLNAGADDYLGKPFDFDELLARIRALLRRDQASAVELRAGTLRLDLLEHSASSAGGRVDLTVRESALLEYLLRHPNHVVTRGQISSGVWPYDSISDSNVVDVYVGYLRRKVPWPADVRIETVRGAGYRLRVS
ncbi:MAG TPA: response regulator transcription factor [Candidatus Nitrosopolaris sp.]|nr:response regulator transcription factor [Candidatus Nitrosopolaris sp.]